MFGQIERLNEFPVARQEAAGTQARPVPLVVFWEGEWDATRLATAAVRSGESQPHNQQSIYYQYRFYGVRKRWPTWADAIAHCSPSTKDRWIATLKTMGHWSEPDGEPIADPPGESFHQMIDGIGEVTTHQLEQP